MSHYIIVKDGHKKVLDLNVSGDLAALYSQLKGIKNYGTNGEGRVEVKREELEKIVNDLPKNPSSNQGIHIVQRCLTEMLEDFHDTKKFIFHIA